MILVVLVNYAGSSSRIICIILVVLVAAVVTLASEPEPVLALAVEVAVIGTADKP